MSSLGACTSPDLRRSHGLLVVPVGATEQHGPHLPLSTDTDIAVALAARFAEITPEAVVAPPLAYGASGEHQGFPGTLSIGQAAVELMLVELVRSSCETFARVLLVSTHGGNAEAVRRAVLRLGAESRDVRAWSPAAAWRGDAHAGRTETSVMLALEPQLVRMAEAFAGNPLPLRDLLSELRAGGLAAVSPNGVLGDPQGATAAEGAALLDAAVQALSAAASRWTDKDGPWL